MLSRGRSRNGQLKNQSSIMPEDYEESISLTLRTRISLASGLPILVLLAHLARHSGSHWRFQFLASILFGFFELISSLNLRVSWKPVNPQDCVWENLYRIIMRTILQEKGQFTTTLQFGRQIYSYASSHEDSSSKGSSGQGMGKVGENFGVEFDESQK